MTIPQHIAIIMDGNGRWAKARGFNRSVGHQAGVETVKRITEACSRMGVKYLTLYTFSTENWNRPADEVAALMSLVLTAMEEELFMQNNVKLKMYYLLVCHRIEDCVEVSTIILPKKSMNF